MALLLGAYKRVILLAMKNSFRMYLSLYLKKIFLTSIGGIPFRLALIVFFRTFLKNTIKASLKASLT